MNEINLNPVGEYSEKPISKLLLFYGGTATAARFDIAKEKDLEQSIVIYERTYENRDMSTYVKLDKDDLFIRCKFINCTGLDSLRIHDCCISHDKL